MKIKFICTVCGDDDLIWKGALQWNQQEQLFIGHEDNELDYAFCDLCRKDIEATQVRIDHNETK